MSTGYPRTVENVGNTAVAVRSSPGTIWGGSAYNTTGDDGYLLFYDLLPAQVVVGTTPPTYYVPILGFSVSPLCRAGEGIVFRNAITVAAVNAINGTTARATNVALVIG